jgi:carbamoyltransferase
MKVLGFSNGHDKGAVIIEDGKIKVGISQERLSRVKHDGAYQGGKIPWESINYCLNYLGWTYNDLDLAVYSTTEIIDDVQQQFQQKVKNFNINKLFFIPHHLAHAYSSFFSSGLDEAAVIVADASGSILNYQNKLHKWYSKDRTGLSPEEDWTEAMSIFKFTKNGYEEVYKKWIKYPIPVNTSDETSLGMLYGQGCKQLVYDQDTNSWAAGKLMGLASYADEDVVNDAELYVKELDNDIFIPNTPIYPRVSHLSDFASRSSVAGIYQREQERASLILSRIAKNLTNSPNVCTSGGSFLNCNANQAIVDSNLWDSCFFVPPSDDSGIPLGCAWFAYQKMADIEKNELLSPYLGKTYSREEIVSAINSFSHIEFTEFDNFEDLTDIVSHYLSIDRVIGWFQGGSEIGPRALGNRSILASPAKKWMTNFINAEIKEREWYRPFAPSVLHEYKDELFESPYFSPYMLTVTKVREEWRNKIPAVTHIDGSARPQSVTREMNEKFYKLISKFNEKTGIPCLLNTSFNGPHEPIIETPVEAINTFLRQKLDYLVLGNFLLTRV